MDCKKFTKDKAKYKLKTSDLTKKYKDKFKQAARKGAVFKWTEQCSNAFGLLKSELVKRPRLQYPNPNKQFMLFTDASKHSYSGILHQEETPHIQVWRSTSFQ